MTHSALRSPGRRRLAAGLVLAAVMASACSDDLVVPRPATVTATPGTAGPGTTGPGTMNAATTTTVTTTTTRPGTTSTTSTTSPTTTATEMAPASYPLLAGAVADLARGNAAVSVSVRRRGTEPFDLAVGARNDWAPVAASTPFVLASVSKLLTATAIARLVEAGRIGVDDVVPWAAMAIAHDPGWDDVTVRELLDHTSGMPVARRSWLDDPAPCSVPLEDAMAGPPTASRGSWRYSNGNHCALGLLVEHLTGQGLADATATLVLERASVSGGGLDAPFLAREGDRPTAAPYPKGVARLRRLGGAGEWLASSADVASVVASISAADRQVIRFPGLMVDQYGWGHTGTIDGAKACAWVIDDDRTVLVALVAGQRPSTGGAVCDRLLPALLADLGAPDRGPSLRFPR